ncbi:hypothetical protein ACOSP7_009883 [Xanthoceras sorbifolium]
MQVQAQIQATKKGSLSITDYILKMRGFSDSLAAVGQPMSNKDLMLHVLQGLGSEYDAVIVTITMSIYEAQFLLMSFEARLEQQASSASLAIANASANFTQSRGGSQHYSRGRRGRGRGNGRGRGIVCQLCGRIDHFSAICYHRFDQNFQGNRPNSVNQGGGNNQ